MTRLKLAEVTSGVGALVLGVGLGALFVTLVAPAAGFVTLAGVILHAVGMWDKHRLEAQTEVDNSPLAVALYWVCWAATGRGPGVPVRMTLDQAARLWGCDEVTGRAVVDILVARGVLRWSRDGRLVGGTAARGEVLS